MQSPDRTLRRFSMPVTVGARRCGALKTAPAANAVLVRREQQRTVAPRATMAPR